MLRVWSRRGGPPLQSISTDGAAEVLPRNFVWRDSWGQSLISGGLVCGANCRFVTY